MLPKVLFYNGDFKLPAYFLIGRAEEGMPLFTFYIPTS